jgi:hypothetical protein
MAGNLDKQHGADGLIWAKGLRRGYGVPKGGGKEGNDRAANGR